MAGPEKKHTDGHRRRLRERFLRAGLDGLQDYEAIELLLTYAIPRRDVKPLAKELLETYGSLEKLLDATPADLLDRHGMGPSGTTLVLLIRQLCSKYLEQKIRDVDVLDSSAATERFLRMKLGGGRKETFMVIFMNSHNHVLDFQVFPGTVDRAAVYPREIAEKCLRTGAEWNLHALRRGSSDHAADSCRAPDDQRRAGRSSDCDADRLPESARQRYAQAARSPDLIAFG